MKKIDTIDAILFVTIGALIMLWMIGIFIDLGWVGIVGLVLLGISPIVIKFSWNKFVDFRKYYNNKTNHNGNKYL